VSLILITPPVGTPISLHEARAQCRVDDDSEDALIVGYIRSASEHVEQLTGLKLLDQTWEWTVDGFPDRCGWLRLPLAPLLQLVSILYQDTQGNVQTLDPLIYRIEGIGSVEPARLILAPNQTWPSTWHGFGAVIIRMRVGWVDHNSVPEALRVAVGMLVAHFYSFREPVVAGSEYGPASHVPYSVRELVSPYRIFAI
jgi:uncharacterized phiE125 gp8 family phage protein